MQWRVIEDKDLGTLHPVITNGNIFLSSCGTPVRSRWQDALTVTAYLNDNSSSLDGWSLEIRASEPNLVSVTDACICRHTWLNLPANRPHVRREIKRLFKSVPITQDD